MVPTSVVSSISRFGTVEPFDLQVARGQIAMHATKYKFGYSSVIGGTRYPIWNLAADRVYLTTAVVMTVSSSSTNDVSPSGTGARTILMEGLGANYLPISEVIALAGGTAVTTANAYLRVTGLTVLTCGNMHGNAGSVYAGTGVVTAGVPAVVHELIPIGFNKESSGVYTVPAGYTAYMRVGGLSCQDNGNGYVTGQLVVSNSGSPFVTSAVTVLRTGQVDYDFPYPMAIPEKSDVEARAVSSSGINTVTSYFGFILIKNNGQA